MNKSNHNQYCKYLRCILCYYSKNNGFTVPMNIDRICIVGTIVDYTAVRMQNALTLSSEIVQESDFSDTAYNNSTYVSNVQSLIAKSTYNNFSARIIRHKIEMFGDIWIYKKCVLKTL